MLNFLRNLRLHVKVSLLGAVSLLITAAALVLLAVWQNRASTREVCHDT